MISLWNEPFLNIIYLLSLKIFLDSVSLYSSMPHSVQNGPIKFSCLKFPSDLILYWSFSILKIATSVVKSIEIVYGLFVSVLLEHFHNCPQGSTSLTILAKPLLCCIKGQPIHVRTHVSIRTTMSALAFTYVCTYVPC